jgi:hypothetical protein
MAPEVPVPASTRNNATRPVPSYFREGPAAEARGADRRGIKRQRPLAARVNVPLPRQRVEVLQIGSTGVGNLAGGRDERGQDRATALLVAVVGAALLTTTS